MVFHCFSSAFQSVVPFESKPRIIRMIIMIAFGFFLASGDANEWMAEWNGGHFNRRGVRWSGDSAGIAGKRPSTRNRAPCTRTRPGRAVWRNPCSRWRRPGCSPVGRRSIFQQQQQQQPKHPSRQFGCSSTWALGTTETCCPSLESILEPSQRNGGRQRNQDNERKKESDKR